MTRFPTGGARPADVRTVLVASDKYKGTLTAAEVGESLAAGIQDARGLVRTVVLPVADGGDGSVSASLAAGFAPVVTELAGPHGDVQPVTLSHRGGCWLVEVADVCGLAKREPITEEDAATADSGAVGAAVLEAAA